MEPSSTFAGQPSGLPTTLAPVTFRSRDFDEVRAHVSRMYCEHQLQLVNRRSDLDTLTRGFECRSLAVAEVAYGADVLINPGSFEEFYLVQIPTAGRAWRQWSRKIAMPHRRRCARSAIICTPTRTNRSNWISCARLGKCRCGPCTISLAAISACHPANAA